MDYDTAEALLGGLPMPIVYIGADERIKLFNKLAQELFGQDNTKRHVVTVIRQPTVLDAINHTLTKNEVVEARFMSRDHAQETLYRVRCVPLDLGEGLGVLASFYDITSMETAGQMRRDFVANVSHELRTPLTAILGFIETLRGPARDDREASERFLETMAREAERMNRLVNDLLSLSRLESEERMRPTEKIDIAECLETVIRSITPLANAANVELRMAPPEQCCLLPGDADQLSQVFTNLAENAIKYGGDGGLVEISCRFLQRDPILRRNAVQIDVKDHGVGFDQMHAHRLTERFYRVDNHRSRSLGGTGLGLAIVKHIVQRHRGRLNIKSEPGQGSCFSVILPDS
ncbi:MAG: ATP-binding protein [Mangrovicoccus sp.]